MISRIRAWLNKENGASTAALFIFGMPLIVGAFGFGFDALRFVYIHDYLQGRANIATQAGVNLSYTDPAAKIVYLGTPSAGAPASLATATSLYYTNTLSKRAASTAFGFLSPVAPGTNGVTSVTVLGSPISTKQLCTNLRTRYYGVQLTSKELVPTTFSRILGIQNFTATIVSNAYVRSRGC